MEIHTFELPPIGTNTYLLSDAQTGEAILIDASMDAYETITPILAEYKVQLKALLLTHGHWDHTLDAHRFKADGVAVYAHKGDRHLLEEPEIMEMFMMPGIQVNALTVDHWLENEQELDLAGQKIVVLHVPGHSEGSLVFYFPKLNAAFSGDTVFANSIGRSDFPGGNHKLLIKGIKDKILVLPPQTKLYPGHGPQTAVAQEQATNPFLH